MHLPAAVMVMKVVLNAVKWIIAIQPVRKRVSCPTVASPEHQTALVVLQPTESLIARTFWFRPSESTTMKIPAFPLARLSIIAQTFSPIVPFQQSILRWWLLHSLSIYSIFLFFVKPFQSYRINLTQIFFCEPGNFCALCLTVWIVSIQFPSGVCNCMFLQKLLFDMIQP